MSEEFSVAFHQFKCACVDYDPVVCFYLRYNKNPLELSKEDVCECECHANYEPDNEDVDERDTTES